MTTKDVIKMLPLDDTLKMQVLNMYDYMEPAQKLTIEVIAWRSYDLMRQEKLDINLAKEFEAVDEGKSHFGKGFYSDVVKKTDQQEQKDFAETASTVDLAAARRAMEQIINEIRAAKNTPKTKQKAS
jgi:hypothetical protein